jgi:hypothetical protein
MSLLPLNALFAAGVSETYVLSRAALLVKLRGGIVELGVGRRLVVDVF